MTEETLSYMYLIDYFHRLGKGEDDAVQGLPTCGAYFTDLSTIPLSISAHGQSPSHIYHPYTRIFTYSPQPIYFP